MSAAEPLQRTIQSMAFTDSEIRRIMQNASDETTRIMKTFADKEGIGAAVRSAQVALANMNVQMWGNVGDALTVGVGDAVWNATEMQALFDENLFAQAGFSSRYWRASMMAQAKEGLESVLSRQENGIKLSDKVYKNSALSKGILDSKINTGLALGKSAAEIAADVIGYINPATPGGASYAAMRLGRTEVNNAFHTTSKRHYRETPWINLVQWTLSGSHPKPDECNEYADSVHVKGQEAGVFHVFEVPDKPHPNCLCYISPVMPDLDTFAKQFKQGKYDDYINKQMGCYRVA